MSWDQLIAIKEENREAQIQNASEPPGACPRDGTPLEILANGIRHCRFDGYQWPRDGKLL